MGQNEDSSVVMKIRFPKYLYDWLKKKAEEEMRPLSMQIALYIRNAYEEEQNEQKKKRASPESRAEGWANSMGSKTEEEQSEGTM
jgi:hypothetical protein